MKITDLEIPQMEELEDLEVAIVVGGATIVGYSLASALALSDSVYLSLNLTTS
ncbi:hypothetical protein [Nostoc sp.]|uniref:hypothetical protein n=1 Tax=Nostoc sp. TaxID=1180 RepID=UPI002FF53F58